MDKPKRIWRGEGSPSDCRSTWLHRGRGWRVPSIAAIFVVLAAVFLGLAAPVTDATTTTTLSGKVLREQLAGKKAELKQATSKLDALQAELDEIAERQNAVEIRLANLEEEIDSAEQQIAQSQADLAEVRNVLEDRLVGIYKQSSSGWPYAEVLLECEDLTSVLERVDALSHIASEDQRLFDEVEDYLEDQQSSRRALQEKQAQQQADLQELTRVQEEAATRFVSADQVYRDLKSQISKLRADIAKADAAAAAAAAEARRLAIQRMAWQQGKRWDNSSDGTIQPPPFTFPVDGPHSFIDSWGYARPGGRTHKGTDVMAARGTRLVACSPGVVSRVSRTEIGLGGITVHIRGDNGYIYYYAHLDRVAAGVYVGMRVKGGTLVGYVGNTGNARGGACHLHFGMQPGGGASVNPYATLRFYDN